MQTGNLDCAVSEITWHGAVPFGLRASCIRAMFCLLERLFSKATLETSVEMWWDSPAYDWACGNRSRANGGEGEPMQDVMFETLSRVLELGSPHCQGAAQHGLGDLQHPGTEALIQSYLDHDDSMEPALREYARAAARFDVL